MGIIGILILSVSVALDALAVSFSGALIDREHPEKHAIAAGIAFGGFQFLMPLIGFAAGKSVIEFISSWDHYAAFALLALVGGNMIFEVMKSDDDDDRKSPFHFPAILVMAVATSLDALAVGASLAFIKSPILITAASMGIVTMIISMAGVMLGSFSTKFALPEKFLGCLGGLAVILIGFKVLIEHSLN